jgi:hypothetical protein
MARVLKLLGIGIITAIGAAMGAVIGVVLVIVLFEALGQGCRPDDGVCPATTGILALGIAGPAGVAGGIAALVAGMFAIERAFPGS